MTRRTFAALAAASFAAKPAPAAPRTAMGVGTASYHLRSRYDREAGETPITETLKFVEYCRDLGAGGVQAGLNQTDSAYVKKLRSTLEKAGMYFEASGRMPRSESDIDEFRDMLKAARDAGATVVRTVLFPGRRYENHKTRESYRQAEQQAWKSVTLAEPTLRKMRMKAAIENHKNLRIPDMLEMMRKLQSEYVGVCVDFGNNYALMEDAQDVVSAFAPYALTSHIKDHILQEYGKGFLLYDAPLGEGMMDVPALVKTLQQAQPKIRFILETMTRDALEIPYLTDDYWAAMEDVPGRDVARTIATVKRTQPKEPLPKISALSKDEQIRLEDENNRKGLAYGRERLGI